jgi:RNA polymerase sigma factor (sigma-70 family)
MELIARAQAGDAASLNELCAFYLPRLQRFARARLQGWLGAVDAQDLVQDTFAHVVQRIHAFEPRHENAFEAYLRQAFMNRLRDELRWLQRRPTEPLEFDHVDDAPSPVEEAIGTETRARYEAALLRLRRADRDAIVARIEHGHSYPDVARVLGKPSIAAAHVAVSRALGKLAKEMQPEWA